MNNRVQILLNIDNHKATLLKCLASIIKQETSGIELDLIICDNLSIDGSAEIIDHFLPLIAEKFDERYTILTINEAVGKLSKESAAEFIDAYYHNHEQADLVIRIDGDCRLPYALYIKEQLASKALLELGPPV